MKQTMKLFMINLRQIAKDGMLLVLLPAPFLVGIVFKFGIPLLNTILEEKAKFSLLPWYGVIDGLLIAITPMFIAMVASFSILEERDEGITVFYQVTPATGYYYLLARIGIPMLWSLFSTIVIAALFSISNLAFDVVILTAIIGAFMGVSLSMMVISLAGNRVEGLALSKLMAISLLGLPLAWFIPTPYQYIAGFLPSFWIGKIIAGDNGTISFALGILVNLMWATVFIRKFQRKAHTANRTLNSYASHKN